MKASTHTEVYRRFEGELRRHPLRPLVIAASGVRAGFKRKLPALLLYIPVSIMTIAYSVRVYASFAARAGELLQTDDPRAAMASQSLATFLGDVVTNILALLQGGAFWALLAMTWYGAGMIAEDRRLGANLLYFSRPITRFDYLLGKFLGAGAFGALAITGPCVVVCITAAFSSKDWVFVTEEWDTILKILALSLFWVSTITVVVLAISSLVQRKTYALVGVMGFVVLSGGVSKVLARLLRDNRFSLLSIFDDFARIGEWLFDRVDPTRQVGAGASALALGALWVASLAILTERVRRMEVVA